MLLFILLNFFFVSFTDKGSSSQVALSPYALQLRQQRGISLDSLDYAVSADYLDSLRQHGARICHTSRWMNGATIETNDSVAQEIAQLPFVRETECTRRTTTDHLPSRLPHFDKWKQESYSEAVSYGGTQQQLDLFNLPPLHRLGYEGQGVPMAVIDAGFHNVDTLACFASLRKNGQLTGIYNLTDEAVDPIRDASGAHGTRCLGLIAGKQTDSTDTYLYYGAATQASFYLFKSEELLTETRKEIDNWVAALEMCDSLGVWISTSSLGYYYFDDEEPLQYSQMDGKTFRSSRAATIAARKGMLVLVAIGNCGNNGAWHWLDTPSDADSILTVGAVGSDSLVASFSSFGPSYDNRVKPEVCAMGRNDYIVNTSDNSFTFGNGTSFATPLVAGLAACLWSAFPDETNMQIRERIISSAHNHAHPDGRLGYGIPDAWKAYSYTPTDISSIPSQQNAGSRQMYIIHGHLYLSVNGHLYTPLGTLVQ